MALKLYKRGGVWHYRGTVAGRLLRRSTETSDETRAKRIAAEAEALAWKGKLDGPEETFTFAHACGVYLNAGRSARMVRMVADYWRDTLVKDIKTPAIHAGAWKLFPNTTGNSRNNRFITPTQCIINYSAKQGLCAPVRVERFKIAKPERPVVTLEWLHKFSETASPQIRALAWFMFLTAARISEALAVEWSDIEGRMVRIRTTKTGARTRVAHMPPMLMAALSGLTRYPDDPRVFGFDYPEQARHHWRMNCKRAGVPFMSFHCCRHGFATGLLHSGLDPVTVAKLGGWASPQHIWSTYGHAMQDATLTDRLTNGTKSTQGVLLELEKNNDTSTLPE